MYRISRISEYLDALRTIESQLRDQNTEIVRPVRFYRGEEECFPTVISSLFQLKNKSGSDIELVEKNLIREAKIRFPEIVAECNDNIEMLIKFQHYGLPTRLLDITSNPLIALYIACNKKEGECDGRVLVCKNNETDYLDVQAIGTILGMYGITRLKSIIKKVEHSPLFNGVDKVKIEFLLQERIDKPLLFRAPHSNPRIKVQQGAFVLTPFKAKIPGCKCVVDYKDEEEGILDKMFDMDKTIVIDKDSKKTILDDLDIMGYNEATIFPEEEHKMNYIKKHYMRFKEYDWQLDLSD